MANEAIKNHARKKKVNMWELADKLGIADTTLSRKLRHELTIEETESALQLIDEIAAERK